MSLSLEQEFNIFARLPEIDGLIYVLRQIFVSRYNSTIELSTRIRTQQFYTDDYIQQLPGNYQSYVIDHWSNFEQWITDQVHLTMDRTNQIGMDKPFQRSIAIRNPSFSIGVQHETNIPPLPSFDQVNNVTNNNNYFPIPTNPITRQSHLQDSNSGVNITNKES
jgi:hypothetical protein